MPGSDDLMAGYAELVAAQGQYRRARDFYCGDVGETFASPRIRQLLSRSGIDNIDDINYARIPVDVIANRLKVLAVTATGPEEREAPEAQAALGDLIARNQLKAECALLHRDVGMMGDAYLFVWPVVEAADGDSEEGAEEGSTAGETPADGRIVSVDMLVNSAETTRAIYDAEYPLRIAYVIKSWQLSGEGDRQRVRANLYYPDRTERWVTLPGQDPKDPKSWESFDKDVPNPWGLTWFHFRTDRPYGVPDHKPAYGPQQLINKLVTAHAATIDFQSFPQRYALDDPKIDQIVANFSDPFHPEDDSEDPEGEHNESVLRADPAAVWRLTAKAVGQFEPSNPDTFLRPYDRYVRAMAETCEIPLFRFGSGFAQTPSGEALRTADAPTTSKVKARQEQLTDVYDDAYTLALHMLGIDDVTVSIKWAPAQTVTDAEGWTTVGEKISNGVPVKQALIETGYLPDQVDEWLDADEESMDLGRRIALVAEVAGVAQQLGAAISLGAMSAPQAQQVIIAMLGDLLPPEDTPEIDESLGEDGQKRWEPGVGLVNNQRQGGSMPEQGQADDGFAARQADAAYEFVGG